MDAAHHPPPAAQAGVAAPEEEAPPHHHPNYIGVWVMLAVLTGVELGVAFLPWSKTTLILILVALAVWKALLVALYYMHLRFEPNRLRLLAVAPLPLAVILVIAVIQEYR
ncbi:MAG: cytochrome C oxidase subunit IV family protein [Gemmatimonadaceae bacterium]